MSRSSVLGGLRVAVFLAALAVSAAAQSSSETSTLQGRILDADSLQPVYLVEVRLVGTDRRAITDRDGRFVFEDLRPRAYTISALHVAYEDLRRHDVEVPAGEIVSLEIELTPRGYRLEEVIVTPGAYSFMEGSSAVRQTMSREEIEAVPQIAEDVFRAVNRLPGLTSGDYAAHFSIRGGRHDETLILFDDLELYEPYHLKDFNEGAISIIDSEVVDGVELMTGGFPARWGNKRSGVFRIRSRTPRFDQARYSLGISLMNARALGMGPLRDGKGSWLVSARSGYMDLVFNLINQDDLPSPRYHDVLGKLTLDLGPKHVITLEALHAGDTYTFDAASTTGFNDSLDSREQADNRYGNSYFWTTLESLLGERTTVTTMAWAGLVTRRRDGTEFYTDTGEPIYELFNERDLTIFAAKQDWTTSLAESFLIQYGFDVRRLKNTDRFRSEVGQDPNDPSPPDSTQYPVETESSVATSGTTTALYLSGRWRVASPLVIDAGARYDRATYTGDEVVSPRVNLALTVGERRTLRAGWGHYRQFQGIDEVSALDEGDGYYPSELTEQWTVGLEQLFENGSVLRLDAYLKDGSELRPVYRNWKGGIDVFPETNEDRILVFPISSRVRGVEVYFDQRFGERTALRAGYSYAVADETVDRIENVNRPEELVEGEDYDREHPIPTDQRHAVNVDVSYRLGHRWTVAAAFAFHTGWPATLEKLVPIDDQGSDFVVLPQKLYGERLPSYQRLDVRFTRRWTTSKGDFRAFVEVINLTNHANVFGYDCFRTGDGSELACDEETWFSILPSLGISWNGTF